MHLLHTLAACRDFSKTLHARPAGNKPYQLALVPTMGALHEGHMALVSLAQQSAGQVVVSIFVNPTQFGPSEDLSRYPRPLEADLARCEAAGVNAVFLPDVTEMYPHGQAHDALTLVTPPANLTGFACGKSRPGHYSGVATVVLKLLNILQPELAVFGEKDAQQLAILRRMVADLNVPVTLLEHPVVRETEGPLQGVAMSSRNRYLTRSIEHEAARCLSATLNSVRSQSKTLDQQAAAPLLHTALENSLATLSPEAREVFQLDYLLAVDPGNGLVYSRYFACLPDC